MLERGKMDRDLVEFVVIDQLVPKEYLLRKIDAAADSGRSQRKYLLPLVSGIHAAGGNTAFFHGELKLPASVQRRDRGSGICVDFG